MHTLQSESSMQVVWVQMARRWRMVSLRVLAVVAFVIVRTVWCWRLTSSRGMPWRALDISQRGETAGDCEGGS
jgi:hypothetical protein